MELGFKYSCNDKLIALDVNTFSYLIPLTSTTQLDQVRLYYGNDPVNVNGVCALTVAYVLDRLNPVEYGVNL